MRKGWVLALWMGVGFLGGSAQAEVPQAKIAVIDLAHVFEAFAMTQDLEAKFEERRRSVAAEAGSKRSAIEAKRADLMTLKPDSQEFADQQQQVTRMEVEYEVWAGLQERLLKQAHKRWLLRIYNKVRETVAGLARRSNIDVVLTYAQLDPDAPDSMALRQQILLQKVIYFDNRVDLTQAVLDKLNDDYQKAGGAASLKLSFSSLSGERPTWKVMTLQDRAPGQAAGSAVEGPPAGLGSRLN